MGNCLKRSQTDDISLLRDTPSSNEDSSTIREPVDQPSYYAVSQCTIQCPPFSLTSSSFSPSQDVLQAGMHIPSGSLSQMTEEEHVRIAKRMGLIQHLPVGYYDGTGSRRSESESVKDTSKCNNNQFNLTISDDTVCSEYIYFGKP